MSSLIQQFQEGYTSEEQSVIAKALQTVYGYGQELETLLQKFETDPEINTVPKLLARYLEIDASSYAEAMPEEKSAIRKRATEARTVFKDVREKIVTEIQRQRSR